MERNVKLIIVSVNEKTYLFLNGKVYGKSIDKIEFSHEGGELPSLRVNTSLPLIGDDVTNGFEMLLDSVLGKNEKPEDTIRKVIQKTLNDLSNFKTCELVEELVKREGVDEYLAVPYTNRNITVHGPARILVVID